MNENGYISDYLTHWTGKNGDQHGAEILSTIASTRELLLSYNQIHVFDLEHQVHEKMVCFTDVPLAQSEYHCQRYGKFGIAFKKLKIMNVGAQPVFYASHAARSDMNTIFSWLQEQTQRTTVDPNTFRALHKHFYFMQRLSDGIADGHDTFYYEREWRLGAQSLPTQEELNRDNPKYHCQQEGYSPYVGKRISRGDKEYFSFSLEDVAFLISPQEWIEKIHNPHKFTVIPFESLAGGTEQEN